MKSIDYDWEWLNNPEDDCKIISQPVPAVTISKSGHKVFCNQTVSVWRGWLDVRNNPVDSLKFGDFSSVPPDVMEDICHFADKMRAAIEWKVGDFMLIDNEMVKHSREPYIGATRKIFASLLNGKKVVKKGAHISLGSGD